MQKWAIKSALAGRDISNWVWGLSAPMHLGLNRWVLCAPYQIMGAMAPDFKT